MIKTACRKPGTLSFCMIAKNEERDLPGCLDSVRELASELVVVGTGSTDGTPRIAAKCSAKVIALMLDADERLARNKNRFICFTKTTLWERERTLSGPWH